MSNTGKVLTLVFDENGEQGLGLLTVDAKEVRSETFDIVSINHDVENEYNSEEEK